MNKYVTVAAVVLAAIIMTPTAALAKKEACTKEQAKAAMSTAVLIERLLPENEVFKNKDGELIGGSSGSGWRFGANHIATIGHVTLSMKLSPDTWKNITIKVSEAEYGAPVTILETQARLVYFGREHSNEVAAVIELKDPLPERVTRGKVRFTPLENKEPVMAAGYVKNQLRLATGKLAFPEEESEGSSKEAVPKHLLPFNLTDDDKHDRLAIDHGASGGPIFDCEGNVVAISAKIATQDLHKNAAVSGMIASFERLSKSGIMDLREELAALRRTSTGASQHNVYGLPVGYFPPQPRK